MASFLWAIGHFFAWWIFLIFVFHQRTVNGNRLRVKLNSTRYKLYCWNEKIKFRISKTFCVSLNLNFAGEKENTETDRFYRNGPDQKTANQSALFCLRIVSELVIGKSWVRLLKRSTQTISESPLEKKSSVHFFYISLQVTRLKGKVAMGSWNWHGELEHLFSHWTKRICVHTTFLKNQLHSKNPLCYTAQVKGTMDVEPKSPNHEVCPLLAMVM